jgi:hypothetical protein
MNKKGAIIDSSGTAIGIYKGGIINSDGSLTQIYKGAIINSSGAAVLIYKKAVEWTYILAVNPDGSLGFSFDISNYSFYGSPYIGSTRVVTADITYTFSEFLEMLSGSTISIWSDNDNPTSVNIYLNGSSTSSYYYSSGEHIGAINFTGDLTSVRIHLAFGNTSGGNLARVKATINSAGNNSFMLSSANTADL